jgi:serine/threonine-protein kinase
VQALVADFGIAKAIDAAGGERLTETGLSVGTPAYMSPEQATAGLVDGRADIYSLGCVLYELLGGEPPFTGSSSRAIMARHAIDPIPAIRTVRPSVPAHVEEAINRSLQKVPADRFATAEEFATALEQRAGRESPLRERTVPGRKVFLRSRRRAVWLALAVLVGIGAIAARMWHSREATRSVLDANLVAVAPFEVLDPKLGLWREGLVDVLARTLDGLGPLRTVSPTTVLRRWDGRADPTSAEDLARRTGARLAIFGQLVGVGRDSVRLSATLLDVTTGTRRSEFDRSDQAERLSALADSLSLSFMRDLGVSARGPARLSSVGTKSIVALKAFLRGEQHFRRGDIDSAIANFQRAVDLDTTFALAMRRLSLAHGWIGDDLAHPFNLRACRFNHGLSPRDSLLLTADCVGYEGASKILEPATRSYPEDPEVWYQLGEAREHAGFETGATVEEELDAFDRSIALDSTFAEAYVHPIERTLARGDCGHALQYIQQYVQPVGSRRLARVNLPAARAAAPVLARMIAGTPKARPALQPMLDTLSRDMFSDLVGMVGNCADSTETAVWLARMLVQSESRRVPMSDPRPSNSLAWSLAARGHLREAYEALRTKPLADDGSAQLFPQLAELGAVPKDTAQTVLRRWVKGTEFPLVVFSLPWWGIQGDTVLIPTAIQRARSKPDAVAARHTADLGSMYLALARRDTVAALRILPRLPPTAETNQLWAKLLESQGKDSAAAAVLDWHNSPGPLYVLQRLEQAKIAERLGDRDGAVGSYEFVVDMWRHADPELQPYVSEARAALARLSREKTP